MESSIEEVAKIAQEEIDKENAKDPAIRKVLDIVKRFIETHRVMCYGGTAINNLLPPEDQFYNPEIDIPDYDFFSETPQAHAAKLADRIANAGYASVEVKPGAHLGTFKVFADYTGVADISALDKPIFEKLWKNSIEKYGIHYVPPNFLRMSMYLELSRPKGDVSRWKKVYTRLGLLNKHYPVICPKEHQVSTEFFISDGTRRKIENLLINEHVVLLGFNASMLQEKKAGRWKLPLDILATPEKRPDIVAKFKDFLQEYDRVKIEEHEPYGELLPAHTDIMDSKTGLNIVRIYETTACHSYHKTDDGLLIASIPTILQFFFAVLYAPSHFLDEMPEQEFVCNAQHLVSLANDNIARRYKLLTPLTCIGKQESLIDMRAHKSELYEKLSKDKSSPAYIKYFFTYTPTNLDKTQRKEMRKKLNKTLRKIR